MIKIKVIPPESSKNNPLGQKIVQKAVNRLIELKHSNAINLIKDLTCKEHPDIITNFNIYNTGAYEIESCCDSFTVLIQEAIDTLR